MSNYLDHAKRELQSVGYDLNATEEGPNKWIVANLLELLTVFGKQGHSGSSASYCISAFAKLAAFELLRPLTGDDAEWNDVGNGILQNNRCSYVFKENGQAYDINGYVFWHWSMRSLEKDEPGFPGEHKYKSSFTSGMSRKPVVFPYKLKDPEHVEVECFEINKETGEREPGSGWWETVYPAEFLAKKEVK